MASSCRRGSKETHEDLGLIDGYIPIEAEHREASNVGGDSSRRISCLGIQSTPASGAGTIITIPSSSTKMQYHAKSKRKLLTKSHAE